MFQRTRLALELKSTQRNWTRPHQTRRTRTGLALHVCASGVEMSRVEKFAPVFPRVLLHQGRSSVVEQRPFKPKVVGSIPTAPTNISFLSNGLQLFEGPRGATSVRRLAQAAPNERLCCSPLAAPSELRAYRYSWSFEYLHVAGVPAAP